MKTRADKDNATADIGYLLVSSVFCPMTERCCLANLRVVAVTANSNLARLMPVNLFNISIDQFLPPIQRQNHAN